MAEKIRTTFTIGQLANAVEVNVETVRYYHRIGLLPAPERVYGSIRRYSAESLKRLRFVKRAQGLGFTLEEIAGLLALADGTHCAETRSLAEQRLEVVREKLADLRAIESALKKSIAACTTASDEQRCPLIEALVGESLLSQ